MIKINTRKFGNLEIEEDKVINFPKGIPGFPEHIRYTLLSKEETHPFCWLQSIDDPNLALIVIDPYIFKPDYNLECESVIESMKWGDIDDKELLVFVVVSFSEGEVQKITANLMGPIIVNPIKHEAVQVVLQDSSYSLHYDVLQKL